MIYFTSPKPGVYKLHPSECHSEMINENAPGIV